MISTEAGASLLDIYIVSTQYLHNIYTISTSGGARVLGEGQLNLHQIYDSPATNLPASDFALPQPVPQVNRAHSGAKWGKLRQIFGVKTNSG